MPSIYIINPASSVPAYSTAEAFVDETGGYTQVADLSSASMWLATAEAVPSTERTRKRGAASSAATTNRPSAMNESRRARRLASGRSR